MQARSPKGKLVFDGEIFRVYQWKQRLYDGSYATFEVATRPSIVQILPEVDQKIAIAFEEQPAIPDRFRTGSGDQASTRHGFS